MRTSATVGAGASAPSMSVYLILPVGSADNHVVYLDLTWPEPVDPAFVRIRMIPYDDEHMVWLGRAFGMPHAIDLGEGTLTVGNAAYALAPAVIKAMEGEIR